MYFRRLIMKLPRLLDSYAQRGQKHAMDLVGSFGSCSCHSIFTMLKIVYLGSSDSFKWWESWKTCWIYEVSFLVWNCHVFWHPLHTIDLVASFGGLEFGLPFKLTCASKEPRFPGSRPARYSLPNFWTNAIKCAVHTLIWLTIFVICARHWLFMANYSGLDLA